VCGSRSLVEWLANRARPYVFSTAQPPPLAASASAALTIVRDEPHRRAELLATAESLRGLLREQGWHLGDSASQIVPLFVADPRRAVELSASLGEQGLLVPAIRPPSVPSGQSLARISLSHAHTAEMIARLTGALAKLAPCF
jgi:8-amino-7-oxononanoate synthase